MHNFLKWTIDMDSPFPSFLSMSSIVFTTALLVYMFITWEPVSSIQLRLLLVSMLPGVYYYTKYRISLKKTLKD